jgi:nucleotide-binding universal stress UspA family protein
MFKHLLVPTDGSPRSLATVARAAAFAREAGARVTLFYARPEGHLGFEGLGAISSSHLAQELDERLTEGARMILDQAERCLREAGVPCERVVLVGNRPFRLILQAAEAGACDLIFMASHSHSDITALLLGSETLKVLTHSRIPVLVHRG